MLYQCWASVEDGGPTLKKHWLNVNTRRLINAGIILGQRRRRWASVNPALGQRLAFAAS